MAKLSAAISKQNTANASEMLKQPVEEKVKGRDTIRDVPRQEIRLNTIMIFL